MQKKLKYLLGVASLVIAAGIVFIACGSGTPELVDDFYQGIENANVFLVDGTRMSSIVANTPSSSSEEQQPSSSGGGSGPGVSSGGNQTPSSSGGGSGPGVSSGGNQEQSSSSKAVKPSSSAAKPAGEAGCKKTSDQKDGFSCKWNRTGVVTPGMDLKPEATGKGDCTIQWNYLDGPLSDCSITDDNGFSAGGPLKYYLFAELTCSGKRYVHECEPKDGLTSKTAPYLSGACKWSRPTNETTTARGAVPSGVELKDVDGVCVGKTTEDIVYKYDDLSKNWPKEGGPLPEARTYSDVQATIACSGTGYTYEVQPATACPPLKANGGADYQISCKNASQLDDKSCNSIPVVKDGECVDVEVEWANDGYGPTVKFACSVDRQNTGDGSISIKVGDNPKVSGKDYLSVEIVTIPKGHSTVEVNSICVELPTGGNAKDCKLGG